MSALADRFYFNNKDTNRTIAPVNVLNYMPWRKHKQYGYAGKLTRTAIHNSTIRLKSGILFSQLISIENKSLIWAWFLP
ncbi:hypothetical protein FHK02_4790 [Spirosoma sp. LMG 31448]|nr:hypothetical protein [Spirosoma utsteinense]